MRIGRFADSTGAGFWALIDPAGEKLHRIDGDISEWAAAAAAEDTEGLRLQDPENTGALTQLPPVDPGARVFGVGANYLAHLQKLGVTEPPEHPTAFLKPNSALALPGGTIRYPPTTNQLDYEIELVVVLGGSSTDPLLGFTIGNDVSARDAKGLGGLDLFSMKCLDGTCPVGPWIVTPTELGDAGQPSLDIRLRVNGEERQADNTRSMMFSVEEILAYVDERVQLRCGDVIFTGTTCGVGLEDGRFLQPGDVVEAEIEGIGTLRNTVGNPP
ncbi:fumarylacetoacetate hydrolase family protein [Mycolicibacterium porcinum]|uniref:Fumarylacetoacetate hydrolase family protein n=1 Tax=Mycolicibacterium porcinum TaxID=39693 RepID=A0AAW5T1U1_9MYCO|nr:fumarylacetoacetate hydrolase family protein [Mycolicibacterium porcinum]MCV7388110.1 fumarylacetoacetate hydrolase family protein [Mycolicibacterium porcinum]ORB43372.1 hydrolase [Mycolicibacterium porcinum]CDO31205.1 fumarylacetoacetate (FAA) hydrolase [Mycolicibacterium vulneris]